MKKICFLFFITCTSACFAQKLDKQIDSMRKSMARQNAAIDSLNKATDSIILIKSRRDDSIARAEAMEQNSRNLNALVRTMKEREQKEKRNMWLRIGLGLAFLVIGIIGVTRKRKSRNNNTTA